MDIKKYMNALCTNVGACPASTPSTQYGCCRCGSVPWSYGSAGTRWYARQDSGIVTEIHLLHDVELREVGEEDLRKPGSMDFLARLVCAGKGFACLKNRLRTFLRVNIMKNLFSGVAQPAGKWYLSICWFGSFLLSAAQVFRRKSLFCWCVSVDERSAVLGASLLGVQDNVGSCLLWLFRESWPVECVA